MDLIRTWAIFRKEFIHIRRDPTSLIQVILIPIILLLINGYALNFDLKDIPLAVYNQDGSRISQNLIQRFEASRYFQIYRYVSGLPGDIPPDEYPGNHGGGSPAVRFLSAGLNRVNPSNCSLLRTAPMPTRPT